MRKNQAIRVFSELRDLEIFDAAGQLCGIADEVDLVGRPGGALEVAALLVGPGAWGPRLPRWLRGPVRWAVGDALVRVPWARVEHVTSRITLNCSAEEAGLGAAERRLRPWLAKIPFAT